VRAKTGTLIGISALSGWVWSDAADRWIEFSILSSGMSTTTAKDLEDRVVEVLAAHAHAP
jgi:D-alanyl-D-alanine carboxypeptidase